MSLKVDIEKRFKDFTLAVKFESDGEPLGILGASGSGKSMTLKCIAGIETPDAGRIEADGRVLFDSEQKINVRPQKRKIGYLFQNYALFPHMTVAENIACALGGGKAEKQRLIARLLDRYELAGLENRYPAQLSGGQQQRVALARILAYQPRVLLLDEPFSALDAYLKESLQVDMRSLLNNYEGDAVMVTHNRDEVYKLCENLLVLDAGRAVEMGKTGEMFAKPKHLVAARLTGCKNFSRAERLAENRVRAVDWGCELAVEGPVPPGLTHVGVRAHYFLPARDPAAPNAIRVREEERIESPFEWNVMFRNADAAGSGRIWWKVAKEEGGATPESLAMPEYLHVAPQNVLLLEGGDPL